MNMNNHQVEDSEKQRYNKTNQCDAAKHFQLRISAHILLTLTGFALKKFRFTWFFSILTQYFRILNFVSKILTCQV